MLKRPPYSGTEVGRYEAGVCLTGPEETGYCTHPFGLPSAGCGVLLKSTRAEVWHAKKKSVRDICLVWNRCRDRLEGCSSSIPWNKSDLRGWKDSGISDLQRAG